MANWDKLLRRGNVEDRRGVRSSAVGGLGLGGIALVLLFNYLSTGTITVSDVLQQIQNVQVQQVPLENVEQFKGEDQYEVFASTVLGSTSAMWEQVFASANKTYEEPTLVLFRGQTTSECGGAQSQVGPHYCPLDRTIYIDETFFNELETRFGASGDVAQAYVIAHEVGHHVQELLGDTQILEQSSNRNEASIQIELQADCYAGLWAHSIRDAGVFEFGEIKEALDAAAAVGDDSIQKKTTGRVRPESWTHGSSEDRVSWFTKGYEQGTVGACQIE